MNYQENNMNLLLPEIEDLHYKSPSQRIRIITERWLQSEMYCPSCGTDYLSKFPNNTKLADFFCDKCGEIYELKSSKNPLGKNILDGTYKTAIEKVMSSTNPNLFVLNYLENTVLNLTIVPKYFFTADVFQERKALSATAQRAGYIGAIILYGNIPSQGKISVVRSGIEICKENVIENYQKVKKLKTENLESRGWLMDVLNCTEKIDKKIFSLQEVYELFSDELSKKHPDNFNVQAKIRQKLQVLRNKGFIEFLGNGKYRKINFI